MLEKLSATSARRLLVVPVPAEGMKIHFFSPACENNKPLVLTYLSISRTVPNPLATTS